MCPHHHCPDAQNQLGAWRSTEDLKVLWDAATTHKQISCYLQATMSELLRISASADGYAERMWAFLFPADTCRLRLKHCLCEKRKWPQTSHPPDKAGIPLPLETWAAQCQPLEMLGCNLFCHTLSTLLTAFAAVLSLLFLPGLQQDAEPQTSFKLYVSFLRVSSSVGGVIVEVLPNCRHIHSTHE